ncbi:MAG: HesB/YadR/YfhF family protein [Bacillaceae bacterium]|nr:HesB/YadR/YfhF family protein [Bacillaceae bacterium]
MQLSISKGAANFYKKQMELSEGDSLRLYVRVGGCGSGGFSVGVTIDTPSSRAYVSAVNGIQFFVEEDDFWYLDGITIDYNADLDQLSFEHTR